MQFIFIYVNKIHQEHPIVFSILHLFPWSGIINEESQLSDTFRVPDPATGQMRRLISQIPPKEEEMFRNMIRRVDTIVKVKYKIISFSILCAFKSWNHTEILFVGCRSIGRPYNDRCWTNLFPTCHFTNYIRNDAKV